MLLVNSSKSAKFYISHCKSCRLKKKNLNKYLLALFHSREKDMVSNYFVFLSLECLGIGLDYTLYLDEVDPC